MTPRLSVCITACNEERELARCLESIDFAEEIVVVVDARSSDGTEKLARERAQRVEVRPYGGDVEQKRYCASLATGDWIVVIDPDEQVSPMLAAQLRSVAGGTAPDHAGFLVDRVTFHLGRWMRHGDFYPDWTLRVFRSEGWCYQGEDPHGRIAVSGSVGRLEGELLHYSYRDLADQVERIQFFSGQAAAALSRRGRRPRWSDLWFRPAWRFVRGYFLKAGCLDGRAGLVNAIATSFYVFLKYAKLWELEAVAGEVIGAEGKPQACSSRCSCRRSNSR